MPEESKDEKEATSRCNWKYNVQVTVLMCDLMKVMFLFPFYAFNRLPVCLIDFVLYVQACLSISLSLSFFSLEICCQ